MRRLLMLLVLLVALGCSKKDKKAENVPLDKVPPNVMKVAKENLPNVTFDQAWKTTNGNYEVRGKEAGGKVRDIQITPDGKVVEVD
jgi:hypothetical protein